MSRRHPRALLGIAAFAAAAAVPLVIAVDRGAPGPVEPSRATASAQTAAIATLRRSLEEAIGTESEDAGVWSVLAVSIDRADTLFARAPQQALVPASNMKLLTTAAALEYLGPYYRYATYLVANGPIRGGVLEGDLYLYGTGDPTLGTRFSEAPAPELVALADSLVALGVREVRGDLIGDGSYFSGSGTGAGWQPDYMNSWYAAPAGALSVHENLVGVEVEPGEPGGPPKLTFVPGGEGIALRNEAVTGGRGGIHVARPDYRGPIVIRGAIGGGSTSHDVPVGDPAMYAAALFRDVLRERGIALHGGVGATDRGTRSPIAGRATFAPAFQNGAPALQVLAVHASDPLLEILTVINQRSHNFYAEQVLRTVGQVVLGRGSAEAGARAVEAILADVGVDTANVRVVDGSGLSPLNRVSAGDFVALLAWMAETPQAAAFRATLPVAGETRRFRRMGGTPAEGNLQAKTGTIDKVSSLSGYVTAANGELLAFSIIANEVASVGRAKDIENRIGATLAAFDRRGTAANPVARAER